MRQAASQLKFDSNLQLQLFRSIPKPRLSEPIEGRRNQFQLLAPTKNLQQGAGPHERLLPCSKVMKFKTIAAQ